MNKKSILIFVFVLITCYLLLHLFYNISTTRELKQLVHSLKDQNEIISYEKKEIIHNFKTHWIIENYKPLKNKLIGENDTCDINHFAKTKPILILRFYEQNCPSCIVKYIELLNEFFKNKLERNVIIISNHSYSRNLDVFVTSNDISLDIYRCKKLFLKEKTIPFFSILDKKTGLNNIFVPDEDNEDLIKEYLTFINKNYF